MSTPTYDEAKHPRKGDGKYTAKAFSEAAVDLDAGSWSSVDSEDQRDVDQEIEDFQLDVEERGERTTSIARLDLMADGCDEEIANMALHEGEASRLGSERVSTDGSRSSRIYDSNDLAMLTDRTRRLNQQKMRGEGVFKYPQPRKGTSLGQTEMSLSGSKDALGNGHHPDDVESAVQEFHTNERMRRFDDGTVGHAITMGEFDQIGAELDRLAQTRKNTGR